MPNRHLAAEALQMRNRLMVSALVLLGALALFSARLIWNDGQTQTVKAQASPPDFSGIWLGRGIQSLSPSDPMGKKPAGTEPDISYQPWGLEKLKSARPSTGPNQTFVDTNDLALKFADPDGYPRASIHPMRFKVVQTPDFIYFLYEYNQSWRPVAMNRQHTDDPDPTWFGEAVGKWEGNTLVVDAIGFNDRAWLDPIGHPRSEKLHLVEHWTRPDHDTLVDDLTIDDPVAYTKPWTGQLRFKLDHSGELHESIYTATDELRFKNDLLKTIEKSPNK
jgi:hypothetical protein